MAIDPRNLRPSVLTRMLNSTPLGEVISERQLRRHRNRAGYRIGDQKHVDLFRYAAWLVNLRHNPAPVKPPADYEAVKEAARARNAAMSAIGRDIGVIPEVIDPHRKSRGATDFQFFCEAYFPEAFCLPWSDDHLKVIGKIEQAVLRGGLFAMAMPRGSGKALALDTPLPTPFGWTTMGEVCTGDLLLDDEGWPCRVTFATEVQYGRPCYRVRFSDGEEIICDAEHLWTVEDRWSRRNPLTLATHEMVDRVELPQDRPVRERRYRVKMAEPLVLPEPDLAIDPYVLGYWLGDGTSASNCITVHEDDLSHAKAEIQRCGESLHVRARNGQVVTCTVGKGHGAHPQKARQVRRAQSAIACGVPTPLAATWSGMTKGAVSAIRHMGRWDSVRRGEPSSMGTRLRAMGLLDNKHIPSRYLRAAPWQRLALLQGLMDTDGSASRQGRCEITLKDDQLGRDVGDLLSGLGLKWTCSTRFVHCEGRTFGPYLRYAFSAYADFPVFRMPRKRERLGARPKAGGATGHRQVCSIEPVPSVPVRCVQVDSPSSLYLAGRKMVPTHNTTLAETACIWAMLTGAREFVCLIGSDAGHARSMLESIKVEFETNERLLEDYPEAVFPIHALERIHNRAKGQICNGKHTRIVWTADEIVLPTIPDSRASGAIIRVAGIESRIRGMKFKRADGRAARPSLVVLDDPQTDESARSTPQTRARLDTLNGAILNLAGPGQKISGIMPCTVIRPGDMADQILDRDKHPTWQGERTKLVYSFPSNEKLWDRYAQIRADSFRNDGDGHEATEFYGEHRDDMDVGAAIAWPERHNTDELSALQHAMNLKLQDERAFWAEYQNEPLPEDEGDTDMLTAEQVAAKTNGHRRGEVPLGCSHLTMFIDVQGKALFHTVVAWEDDFTGCLIDYGTHPDQGRAYFTLRDVQKTLGRAAPGAGLEGSIYDGLAKLTGDYLSREWRRDDGAMLRIERCLIDANWGQSTDVVYQFCRQSTHSAIVMPSHGRYVGASSVPFSEYKRKRGERVGHHWRIPNVQGRRQVRHVLIDTNYWKSFIHARLAVAIGDKGCLSLFGRKPTDHQLLAEHVTAEYRVRTEARGRVVDEWKLRAGNPDNHWLDCLVGCAVAASMQGATLPGVGDGPARHKKRIKLSDLQGRQRP